ncbi:diguanylate cyclase [Pseudomonas protegens]|uniref:Diguanylate cyclase n=1 Tax=Pseudomonas protegens TaxID=380021 RepID=A0ABY2VRI6_9PSED|nr:diguanylate cyclase [Pseudomonas protegens]QEZ52755.1 diguanylate cyclase [Pseudomonas protegens]QEZ61046.1 diguanylate cyclase [Pseudomonas protegens]QEZ64025.1 diguanylate cyclase [Pseudomonas protegens]TMM67691.1 diguanylate cyclase [Pseudomonas protegens]
MAVFPVGAGLPAKRALEPCLALAGAFAGKPAPTRGGGGYWCRKG